MAHVDFDRWRAQYAWYILETDHYVCHYEQSNLGNDDMLAVLRQADGRLSAICETLDIDCASTKVLEQRPKFNYWIFPSDVVIKGGMQVAEGKPFGTGSASRSGIDYVVHNCQLSDHLSHLVHEEAHLIWMSCVGEAPSILNEGIAVYVEALHGDGREAMVRRFCDAWGRTMGEQSGLLRKLTDNAFFWSQYGKMPVYTLGGALVLFLITRFGMDVLKGIFRSSYFHDPKLAEVIEDKASMTIETLETTVTGWARVELAERAAHQITAGARLGEGCTID